VQRDPALPLFSLGTILSIDSGEPRARRWWCGATARRRLTVDRVIGRQEVVVRTIDDPLVHVPGIAGATDLGDGRPTLVLDLNELGIIARERGVS
jgi:two-component system chemotaxis sensor kinase CheA